MRGLLFLAGIACLTGCMDKETSSAPSLPEITRWAQVDADPVGLLTNEPSVCLSLPAEQEARHQILLGRAAFRSPYLLGGQAARQGISCNACHTNGGVNQYFFIEGMSSDPGTADVTNFHFSKTLGDETFNPKPIPSLVDLPMPETISQMQERTKFVLRLIEKEFDGAAPNAHIKAGLLAYIEALDERACKGDALLGREVLKHRLGLIDELITFLPMERDSSTKEFLRASLRAELGRLHARYPKTKIVQAGLTKLNQKVKLGENLDAANFLNDWHKIKTRALANYNNSLFSPDYVQFYFPTDK